MSNALQIVGGGYTALIRQDHDGNCIALRHASGTDILRTPLTEEAFQKYPNVYGMPLFRPTVFETGGSPSGHGHTFFRSMSPPEITISSVC